MLQQMFEKMIAEFDEIEIIGLIGMAISLVSFLMTDTKIIRIVNAVGAAFLLAYGLILPSFTTFAMNVILITIHVVMLVKEFKKGKNKND